MILNKFFPKFQKTKVILVKYSLKYYNQNSQAEIFLINLTYQQICRPNLDVEEEQP